MKKKLLHFISTTILMLSLASCKQECQDATNPDCPNYDPCIAWRAQTQQIKIIASGTEALDYDTVSCLSPFKFSLTLEADSVKWTIGSDPTVLTDKIVGYYFGAPYSSIEVRCIAYRKDEYGCTGNPIKVDTLKKTLTLVHWPDLPIWNWTFTGAFEDSPADVKHISFTYRLAANSIPILPTGEIFILGLIEPCQNSYCEGVGIGLFNHRKVFPEGACCSYGLIGMDGFVSLDKRSIYFKIFTNHAGIRTFRGYRTN